MKNIQVFAKVKNDVGAKETELIPEEKMYTASSDNQIVLNSNYYQYTKVLDQIATQEELYTESSKPIIEKCFEGYNGSIFVYG